MIKTILSDNKSVFLLLAFFVYTGILALISIAASKKTAKSCSLDDTNMIGNRSINYWVTALSAHASDMSDWLFLAFPAQVFLYGNQSYGIAFGLILGMWATWHFIAIPLRTRSEQYKAITLIDYFEKHFNTEQTPLRLFATAITLFFFIIYIAAGLKGIGLIGETTFQVPYAYGTAIGALIVIMIALIGGFVAAAWTDCFQALFLLGVIIIVPAILFFETDSYLTIAENMHIRSLSLNPFYLPKVPIFCNNMAWGLGYFGMPHILTKLLANNDAESLRKSKYIGITWQILALSAAIFVGIIAIGYSLPGTIKPEQIFIHMVLTTFHPFFAGLMLCGVLAATVSTILAQLLVTATTFTHDMYHKLIQPNATPASIQKLYHLSLISFILFAYCIAYPKEISIFSLVQYAWAGLGSSFGPLVIISLLPLTINRYAAVAGLIGGALGSGMWRFFNGDILWLGYSISEMIPGYCIACISIALVHYATRSQ